MSHAAELAQAARITVLEAALKPFAALAQDATVECGHYADGYIDITVPVRVLRRAAKVLKDTP